MFPFELKLAKVFPFGSMFIGQMGPCISIWLFVVYLRYPFTLAATHGGLFWRLMCRSRSGDTLGGLQTCQLELTVAVRKSSFGGGLVPLCLFRLRLCCS